MFLNCEADGYEQLYNRTLAAAEWYIKAIEEKLIASIKQDVKQVKTKEKVKKYLNELNALLLLFERKKQQLQQAVQLAEALHKSTSLPELLKMVEDHQKPVEITLAEVPEAKKEKKVKGETGRLSLQMFKEGKSISDIATARSLTPSTIEGHLAAFVAKGEVDVLDLIDQEKLDKTIACIKDNRDANVSEIRKLMNDELSYGQVKAVTHYLDIINLEGAHKT
jgi:uncharacterized protein YpbB